MTGRERKRFLKSVGHCVLCSKEKRCWFDERRKKRADTDSAHPDNQRSHFLSYTDRTSTFGKCCDHRGWCIFLGIWRGKSSCGFRNSAEKVRTDRKRNSGDFIPFSSRPYRESVGDFVRSGLPGEKYVSLYKNRNCDRRRYVVSGRWRVVTFISDSIESCQRIACIGSGWDVVLSRGCGICDAEKRTDRL